MTIKIELGDKVRDPLTGIEGIAYSRTTYLQGCDRINIQQPLVARKEDAPKVPDLWQVDEPQLEILEKQVVSGQDSKPVPKKRGRPRKTAISPGGPSAYVRDGKR